MNIGREISFVTFKETLEQLEGTAEVNEIIFRDTWLQKIKQHNKITLEGWYDPPPFGMAVLFASDTNATRISFDSLRNEKNWPSENKMNWGSGLLYAYSSFVDIQTGLPGDFAITLYFGRKKEIINHFQNCFNATKQVLLEIGNANESIELFEKSQIIFSKFNLRNSVVSITDSTPLDLGHSLPIIGNEVFQHNRTIPIETKDQIRRSRKFINGHTNWSFKREGQFTIEPQLVSLNNTEFPQISFHYIVEVNSKNEILLMNQNDELLKKYGIAT